MKRNTNWSSPKKTFLAGMLDLRKALASGQNARLVKMRNEDCEYPIKKQTPAKEALDFRNYEFMNGTLQTRSSILADKWKSEFEKQLSLNYKTCYGTQKAMDDYYSTGVVTKDNFQGQGRSHLVDVQSIYEYYIKTGDSRTKDFKEKYITFETAEQQGFYDNYKLVRGVNKYNVLIQKHKVWVVETLSKDEPKQKVPVLIPLLNWILYPLKFIPTKSVLRMDEYTNYSFRIGSVTHGYEIEFQIPKKFSFN